MKMNLASTNASKPSNEIQKILKQIYFYLNQNSVLSKISIILQHSFTNSWYSESQLIIELVLNSCRYLECLQSVQSGLGTFFCRFTAQVYALVVQKIDEYEVLLANYASLNPPQRQEAFLLVVASIKLSEREGLLKNENQ